MVLWIEYTYIIMKTLYTTKALIYPSVHVRVWMKSGKWLEIIEHRLKVFFLGITGLGMNMAGNGPSCNKIRMNQKDSRSDLYIYIRWPEAIFKSLGDT